jgi:hypothetical protein
MTVDRTSVWSGGDLLDYMHAAWLAGWAAGDAHGRRAASVDLARQWLHEEALRWSQQAMRTAAQRHGPAWAEEIGKQAEGVGR